MKRRIAVVLAGLVVILLTWLAPRGWGEPASIVGAAVVAAMVVVLLVRDHIRSKRSGSAYLDFPSALRRELDDLKKDLEKRK